MGAVSQGRRLATAPTGVYGTIRELPPATDEYVRQARRHWNERDADDFSQSGKTWHERSTGIAYRRVPGNPFLGDSRTSTVNCFLVVDGEFLFLRRENSDRTSHSVMGEVGRVEA